MVLAIVLETFGLRLGRQKLFMWLAAGCLIPSDGKQIDSVRE